MTTYTAITNGQVDADSPVDAPLMQALRDNPLSIQEMADGAPPIQGQWHPYDMSTIGDGTDGEIWSQAADGNTNTIVTPDFDDGYQYMFLFNGMGNTAGNQTWRVELYQETAASYTSTADLHALAPAAAVTATWVSYNLRAGNNTLINISPDTFYGRSATVTLNTLNEAIASGDKVLRVRFTTGGNWNSGSLHLFRRRSLVLDI